LLNLLLTIVTGIIMLLLLVTYFQKRKGEEHEKDPDYDQKVKKHLPFRLITIATTVVAIILFILTENMSLPMGIADNYTLWHVVIAAVTVVFAILSRKKYEEGEGERVRA